MKSDGISQDRIEEILKWFLSDTIEFLDRKLDDSDTDPQYSAITVVHRFTLYLEYLRACSATEKDVFDFLAEIGYSEEDIETLRRQCAGEQMRVLNRL